MAGDTQWKSQLPPELKWMAKVPSSKLVFTSLLKYQIQQMLTQLSQISGIESVLLTANGRDNFGGHLSSSPWIGRFFEEEKDLEKKFANFCTKRKYSAEDISKEASLYPDIQCVKVEVEEEIGANEGKSATQATHTVQTRDNEGKSGTAAIQIVETGESVEKSRTAAIQIGETRINEGKSGTAAIQIVGTGDSEGKSGTAAIQIVGTGDGEGKSGTAAIQNVETRDNEGKSGTAAIQIVGTGDSEGKSGTAAIQVVGTGDSEGKLGTTAIQVVGTGDNEVKWVTITAQTEENGDSVVKVKMEEDTEDDVGNSGTTVGRTDFSSCVIDNIERLNSVNDCAVPINVYLNTAHDQEPHPLAPKIQANTLYQREDNTKYITFSKVKLAKIVDPRTTYVSTEKTGNGGDGVNPSRSNPQSTVLQPRGDNTQILENSLNNEAFKFITAHCKRKVNSRTTVSVSTEQLVKGGNQQMSDRGDKKQRLKEGDNSGLSLVKPGSNVKKDSRCRAVVERFKRKRKMASNSSSGSKQKRIIEKDTYCASKKLTEIKDNPPLVGIIDRSLVDNYWCNPAVKEGANKHRRQPFKFKRLKNLSSACDIYDLADSRNTTSKADVRVGPDYEKVELNSDSDSDDDDDDEINDDDDNHDDDDDESDSHDDDGDNKGDNKDNCGDDDDDEDELERHLQRFKTKKSKKKKSGTVWTDNGNTW